MAHSCPALGLLGFTPGYRVQHRTMGWGSISFQLPLFSCLEEWVRLKVMLFPLKRTAQHFVFIPLGSGASQGEGRINAEPSLFGLFSNSGGVIEVSGICGTSLEEGECA